MPLGPSTGAIDTSKTLMGAGAYDPFKEAAAPKAGYSAAPGEITLTHGPQGYTDQYGRVVEPDSSGSMRSASGNGMMGTIFYTPPAEQKQQQAAAPSGSVGGGGGHSRNSPSLAGLGAALGGVDMPPPPPTIGMEGVGGPMIDSKPPDLGGQTISQGQAATPPGFAETGVGNRGGLNTNLGRRILPNEISALKSLAY